jgi:hypothetical protein
MSYINPKRKQGSQKEVPRVSFKSGSAHVSGYQRYVISPTGITLKLMGSYYQKFLFLKSFMEKANRHGVKSLTDIGCSNGLLPLLGARAGIQSVRGMDHDKECLKLIDSVCRNLKISNLKTHYYKFGAPVAKSDLVTASALIHWVYSCTASFASLERIIDYMASLTKNMLLVEWVAPADPAIKSFKHLNFKTRGAKAPYTQANFEAAMKKNFALYKLVHRVTSTRWLYIGIKENTLEAKGFVDSVMRFRNVSHSTRRGARPTQMLRKRRNTIVKRRSVKNVAPPGKRVAKPSKRVRLSNITSKRFRLRKARLKVRPRLRSGVRRRK